MCACVPPCRFGQYLEVLVCVFVKIFNDGCKYSIARVCVVVCKCFCVCVFCVFVSVCMYLCVLRTGVYVCVVILSVCVRVDMMY